jgi:hypothetical protein
VLCSWHKTKGHICQYRQSFMEWLNLEGIGDKKQTKKNITFLTENSAAHPTTSEKSLKAIH